MPIALDPNERVRLVLASDAGKPEGERPTFIFRHLTARQWREAAGMQDRFADAESGGEALGIVLDFLAGKLAGWENMIRASDNGEPAKPIPFAAEKFDELITLGEAMELLMALGEASAGPTVAEAKK